VAAEDISEGECLFQIPRSCLLMPQTSSISQQIQNGIYPALVLFEQPNCIDWINICYILLLTEESDFLKFVFILLDPGIFCWTL
jgi:hypothetical protein